MQPLQKKLRFILANGWAIKGGDSFQTLHLVFFPPGNKGSVPSSVVQPFNIVDSFWNANDTADVILSYPSLLKHLLGLIPH